uniref:Ankyrin repeat domain 49 n=1 Tax=Eptatretus burgeri TaxID=7764 RepID=A0A8C4Q2D9_EPTBU
MMFEENEETFIREENEETHVVRIHEGTRSSAGESGEREGHDVEREGEAGEREGHDVEREGHDVEREGHDVETEVNVLKERELAETPRELVLWAAQRNRVHTLSQLLTSNKSLNSIQDADGYSALHRAASHGHLSAVRCLLSSGADTGLPTNEGWTPLHCSCRWNYAEVASLLLQCGADINASSKGGQTPLHIAAGTKGTRDVLSVLLSSRYVRPELQNTVGETAHDLALRTDRFAYLFDMVDPCVTFAGY